MTRALKVDARGAVIQDDYGFAFRANKAVNEAPAEITIPANAKALYFTCDVAVRVGDNNTLDGSEDAKAYLAIGAGNQCVLPMTALVDSGGKLFVRTESGSGTLNYGFTHYV